MTMKPGTSQGTLTAAVLVLLPAGCLAPSTLNDDANDLVARTQAATVAGCQFEPAANSIIQILAGNHPGLTAASQVAKSICDLVNDRRLTGGGPGGEEPLVLEGVVIEGRDLTQASQ